MERFSRERWGRLVSRQLEEYAAAAALRCYRRQWPTKQAAWGARNLIKWQCWLTTAESARLDTIRTRMYPGISRYTMTRAMLMAAIEAGEAIMMEGEE